MNGQKIKVLMILPPNTKTTGGNWVTAQRVANGVEKKLVKVSTIEASQVNSLLLKQFDLVHCFHAYKSAFSLKQLLQEANTPWVISFTGTDVAMLMQDEGGAGFKRFLQQANSLIVFHQEAQQILIDQGLPLNKIQVIPQQAALNFKEIKLQPALLRSKWHIKREEILFIFAGGIRPVKGPLEAVDLLTEVRKHNSKIRLIMAGPVLDDSMAQQLKQKLSQLPWAQYVGEIPYAQMPELLAAADVVINTSLTEGMPNTILEAMSLGIPALARDIAGNRAIVVNGENGFLFKTNEEFINLANVLAEQKETRLRLGTEAKIQASQKSIDSEINTYFEVYQKALK
ncbi:MAG: glycosyltransferase [Bacillota bacterium]|nr:glycosyltransferase [Bacillota bacterium]